jgi:hypothetical protein
MDISALSELLRRAERLFKGGGAELQAKALSDTAAALDHSSAATVDDFVSDAKQRLAEPDFSELPVTEIIAKLLNLRVDQSRFTKVYNAMADKSFSKDKAIAVAIGYTGAHSAAWHTKPAALKAIKSFFDQRCYLTAKADRAEKVTPY